MSFTIGCTTRPHHALTLEEACARIAGAGYTDVALFAVADSSGASRVPVRAESPAEDVARVRAIVASSGLVPSMLLGRAALEAGLDAAVEDYRRLIANAAALGARWLLDCGTSDLGRLDDYCALMARCAPYAESAGVVIALKPHGGIALTVEDLVRVHKRVAHRAFTICYDPGNIVYYTRGAVRPERDVALVAPITSAAIVKDCVLRDGEPDVMVTPGTGVVDFPAVLGALARGSFRGPLYVECVAGREVAQIDAALRSTLELVQGILATLDFGPAARR